MSRFSHYDTDEERLPEGMTRVGYDADTQVYTFRDADGSYWESAPGSRYGQLTKVGDAPPDAADTEPFLVSDQPHRPPLSWRTEMRPFLNFGVLVCLCLILLFWFLRGASSPDEPLEPIPDCPQGTTSYFVQKGDTCWDIAKKNGLSVDDLVKGNVGLDCDSLKEEQRICIPGKAEDAQV